MEPLKSKVTRSYEWRRMFNNVRKSQHLGIDFRAKTGVKIPVSNSGKIVLAEDLFIPEIPSSLTTEGCIHTLWTPLKS